MTGEYLEKKETESKNGFPKEQYTNPKVIFAVLICIYIVQLILCIYIGSHKQTLYCDETFSYGLANSEKEVFLEEIGNYRIFRSDYFLKYVTTNLDSIFKFEHVYRNQVSDVHPPLYYYLFHIVSAFSGNNFTIWTGIGLNLFLLIFADLLIYYVAREFLKSPPKAILALILWSFCSAGLSNILLIRMYLMLTAEIFAYIAVHILIIKHFPKLYFKNFFLLILTIMMGGLTHYYFYVYALIFSFLTFLYLLIKRKYINALCYVIVHIAALIINSVCFVETWVHAFKGYRGVEFFSNFSPTHLELREAYFSKYFSFINDSMGPYILPAILFIALMLVVIRLLKDKIVIKDIIKNDKVNFIYMVTVFSGFLYTLVVIQASSHVFNRYIYPSYPIIAIVTISSLFYILKFLKKPYISYIIAGIIVLCMCYTSYNKFGIEYQFPNYKAVHSLLKSYKGYDCFMYKKDEEDWCDIYSGINELFLFDEFCFFNEDDPDMIEKALNERETDNPIIVILPSSLSEETQSSVIDAISKSSKYKNAKKLYEYKPFFQAVYVIE